MYLSFKSFNVVTNDGTEISVLIINLKRKIKLFHVNSGSSIKTEMFFVPIEIR